jgi:hypothetical protein
MPVLRNVPDVPEPMLKTLHSGHVIVDGDHVACSQQKMRHVLAAARADIEARSSLRRGSR